MSKVSIIMPVYNAERYLREAIESVLRQTYTDFEFLLINDRSTDNSGAICREYGEKDARIILLENETETHGPGPTRNIGLDHASGEYIYFMDADDWIEDRLLQCAVHRMKETGANIVQLGVFYERNDGTLSERYLWSGKKLLTKDEIKKDFLGFWRENRSSLWLYLFRREPIKAIRFENIINGEDLSYVLDALCYADKIAYVPEAFYHYRYVESSTSHRWIPSMVECLEVLWNHQKNFLDSFGGELAPLVYAEVAYESYIWLIYQLSLKPCTLPYAEKRKKLRMFGEKMGFETYRNTYPLKLQHGLRKIQYAFVKCRLENVLLLFGPLFLKIIRGE